MPQRYETIRRNWSSLIRPDVLVTTFESDTYGRYVCAPLERGYGHTLGVAMRRALLQAIGGAAIVDARVELDGGAASIEWMNELCLNLAEVIVDSAQATKTVRVEACAGEVLRAGALASPELTVRNPSLILCVPPRDLALDVSIERGFGIALASGSADGGRWPVTARFAPVRRVDVLVSSARVGQRVDYDSLQIEVTTNGVLVPRQALSMAAELLSRQLQLFINFEERREPKEAPPPTPLPLDCMFTRMSELELSVRLAHCLERKHVEYVGELAQLTEKQLMDIRNFGRKSLHEVHELLAERNLELGMTIPDWPALLEAHRAGDLTRRAG
jgi:DNA-directed RNA polymerase subunit alpha